MPWAQGLVFGDSLKRVHVTSNYIAFVASDLWAPGWPTTTSHEELPIPKNSTGMTPSHARQALSAEDIIRLLLAPPVAPTPEPAEHGVQI
ncbi:hypothetical protein NDU88_002073 [Pleurodeles waltl]|uniref:Uncharacterized protein n=1 Tax=Pleurodeles waltl TaxID=8319 RepID=A0AAV7LEL7_PLEWA|nr:hypothetical protein NDU88_002073 [Pleurodeles waltl]